MIVYFADRFFNILGQASTNLVDGLTIVDDRKVEDIDSGVSTFEFTIPFNDATRNDAEAFSAVGNYLLRSHNDEQDFFTVIDCEVDTKRQEVTIYAEDAGLDLLNEIVGAYEPAEAHDIAHYVNKFAYDSGFVIGVNEVTGATKKLAWDDDATAAERIADVAKQFDAEISYSFEIKGLSVTKKLINIYKERGNDVGVQLRLNKELDRIITKTSIANLATALLPEGGTPEDAENPINLSGYTYDDGDIYLEGRYLKSRSAIQKWSRYLNPSEPQTTYTGHILKKYSCEALTQADLCTEAVAHLKKISNVEVNYNVEFEELPDGVKIGDRVNIVDDSGAIYISARILELETSVANKSQSATIGEYLIKSDGIAQKVADLAAKYAKEAQATEKAYLAAKKAQAQADSAAQNAANAQETANSAQTSAESAQTTANTAKQDADAAQKAADDAQTDVDALAVRVTSAETSANNAAKTATNFLSYDKNGLEIGYKTGDKWAGYRTLVNSSSFNVLDESGTVLSTFGANNIDLGNNGDKTVVNMCNGKLTIRYNTGGGSNFTSLSSEAININAKRKCSMNAEGESEGTNGTKFHGFSYVQTTFNNGVQIYSEGGTLNSEGQWVDSNLSSLWVHDDSIILKTPTVETTGTVKIGGNLSANYVTGTWLQGTAANAAPTKQDRVCVMDSSGWVYTRTLAQILGDIGISCGTWTAKINGGSITKQICTYMKVGNMCSISFYITGKGGTGTGTTNFYIGGAPYSPNSSATWYGGGCHVQGLYDTANYPVTGCVIQPNKRIYIRTAQIGGTGTGYVRVNNGGATFHLSGSITYPVA